MSRRALYVLLLCISVLLAAVGGLVVFKFKDDAAIQALGATVAGGGLSLVVSTIVQWFSSHETAVLLRDLTLRTEGTSALPEEFLSMRWIAYATRVLTAGGKRAIEWRICPLRKVGSAGESTCAYSLTTSNPEGHSVSYSCTFVGLSGRVAAILAASKGNERTTLIVFEAGVGTASVRFGPGYIVDWSVGDAFTFALIGTGEAPSDLGAVPTNAKLAFEDWYRKAAWDVSAVAKSSGLVSGEG